MTVRTVVVRASTRSKMSSEDTRGALVVSTIRDVSVYCTYKVVTGSMRSASTTSRTFISIVPLVSVLPTKSVSITAAAVRRIYSSWLFTVAPPGFTRAPSLNMLRPNRAISSWMIVCDSISSRACSARPELNNTL